VGHAKRARRSGATRTIAGVLSALATGAAAQQGTLITAPAVDVVAPTPVPGIGVPRDHLPANAQVIGGREFEQAPTANVPQQLELWMPSGNVNDIQGNPYQADVNYRGYTASPLLGTPQGLSVYQDGVRINAPFADIVSWDLIPQAALDSITLVPGSNPLFGLNTLGGALALRTKSGDTHPGVALEFSGGAWKRFVGQFEAGRGFENGFHAYAAGTWFNEDGWRDYSPSDVKQLFAKVGQRRGHFEWDVGLTVANTDLIGNGLTPQSFLDNRWQSIFTRPDQTRNQMEMLTLNSSYFLTEKSQLSGTLYQRWLKQRTLNGDVNDNFEDGPNDLAAGGTGLNIGTGVNNRTATNSQTGYGGALQWSTLIATHQLALGATYDYAKSNFEQTAQLGIFDNTRAVDDTGPVEQENAVTGRTSTTSVFVTDTWSVRPDLHLTLSGRYNATRVRLQDTGPTAPALDGSHSFNKCNPAAGLAYQASKALTLYGGFSQGNRAPTPIELGCADPARPCTLPNALAADPPLQQVVAQTWELGVRGVLPGNIRWNAGLFKATNTNDILFVGTTTSAGYFTNFGKTQRRGLELGLSGAAGRWQWNASYSFVRATFQSGACIVSENNSSRGTSSECSPEDPGNPGTFLGDDLIAVNSGDRIPNIPEHSFKFLVNFSPVPSWRVGAELIAYSSQIVRGNENNQHQAGTFTDLNGDTRTFLGSGKAAGYGIVNLSTQYGFGRGWEIFARLVNLFDKRYYSAGALAENPFDAAGTFQTDSSLWTRETFYAPGAPRAGWVGVRYRFGT